MSHRPTRSMKAVALATFAFATASVVLATIADARTLRWARETDAESLDPHSRNSGPNLTVAHQLYEPLVSTARDGRTEPALATSWRVLPDNPSIWEFRLRPNVRFHNGNPFNADDVIFSIRRAQMPASDMKTLVQSIAEVIKIDDLTVHMRTNGPNALLPNMLTNLFMMDREWSEANNATEPQNIVARGPENGSTRNANGTGPFVLVSREPDQRTVMRRNDNYWGRGQVPLEITELVYLPIRDNQTRIAALRAGQVDFVQDLPTPDIQRLQADNSIRVSTGPENRVIFFGMDVSSQRLRSSDVTDRNPFSDVRVRQALNIAIDRDAIQRAVMRGQSTPVGAVATSFVGGVTPELLRPPVTDQARARALLAEAGYPNGFSVTLHCTNNRYVEDENICQAVVGMLGRIGIRVNLVALPVAQYFSPLRRGEYDFYLLGWGIPTFDIEYNFTLLFHTQDQQNGGWNGTKYSNPALDARIRALNSIVDQNQRNREIAEIWSVLQRETIYLPLHVQFIAYATRADFEIPVYVDNQPKLKDVAFRRS